MTSDHDSGGCEGGGAAATCAFATGSTTGDSAAPRRSARLGSIHAECKTIASVTAAASGSQAQAQWKNITSGLSGIVLGSLCHVQRVS
jgi:hypothetical protein